MKLLTIITTMLLSAGLAQAQFSNPTGPTKTIDLVNWSKTLYADEMESFSLNENVFVKTLFVQAEGIRNDARFAVYINGNMKHEIYVPGRDPSFTLSVDDWTSSIEIKCTSGTVKILDLKVTVVQSNQYPPHHPPYAPHPIYPKPLPEYHRSVMANISSRAIYLVNALEGYTNYQQYGQYLLPIRIKAATALAIAEAKGDVSQSARPYYQELLTALENANDYLLNTFEIDQAYELAIELMSLREQIKNIMR